ncbi:hypothetical protein L6164_012318 [Bauhinia variegata]|uniref:Uncharacterized protein n=1 Tax=Bauhinia variegata TaxID=167791 RepID=A0ACB9P9Q0_BAUVA|nr:hypothetical protein L6164_012318 [Bauhinia variegata]
MDYCFANPKPYPNYVHSAGDMPPAASDFVVSDYLMLDGGGDADHHRESWSQSTESSEKAVREASVGATATSENNNPINKCETGAKRTKIEATPRIAFRTRSEVEVMDDGYKWRKYGKKSVKNSPNPRNYYKCSSGGCNVKKRVERDRDDSNYVITTYEAVHNHESPAAAYYTQMSFSLLHQNAWPLQQPAANSSLSS